VSGPADARQSAQEVALARLRRKLEREARAGRDIAAGSGVTPAAGDARASPGTGGATTRASDLKRHAPPYATTTTASLATARPRATTLSARLDAYERLIRLDKPIGWLLLLWPTLTALWISCWGTPSVSTIVILVAGTILMRSAGCAFNDWADRDFDAAVKRTAGRPLATGEIAPREALVLGAVLALCAFALVLFTNKLTIMLAFPALAIALAYPFMKRFMALPQAFLGIAFSFGIPMAFAAQIEQVPAIAWWLLLINLFWVVAYDTEYAMVDRDDDLRLGMRTSAITFGRFDVFAVACCYAVNLAGMAVVGWKREFIWPYYAGLAIAALIAIYHVTLIRTRERERCFKAFRHNHWYGLAIFAGLAIALYLRYRAWPTLD
jgi:4-hydroxybenzoate polyprenyltransferase